MPALPCDLRHTQATQRWKRVPKGVLGLIRPTLRRPPARSRPSPGRTAGRAGRSPRIPSMPHRGPRSCRSRFASSSTSVCGRDTHGECRPSGCRLGRRYDIAGRELVQRWRSSASSAAPAADPSLPPIPRPRKLIIAIPDLMSRVYPGSGSKDRHDRHGKGRECLRSGP